MPGELDKKDARGHTQFKCCLCGKEHGIFEGTSYASKYRVCWFCNNRAMTKACQDNERFPRLIQFIEAIDETAKFKAAKSLAQCGTDEEAESVLEQLQIDCSE